MRQKKNINKGLPILQNTTRDNIMSLNIFLVRLITFFISLAALSACTTHFTIISNIDYEKYNKKVLPKKFMEDTTRRIPLAVGFIIGKSFESNEIIKKREVASEPLALSSKELLVKVEYKDISYHLFKKMMEVTFIHPVDLLKTPNERIDFIAVLETEKPIYADKQSTVIISPVLSGGNEQFEYHINFYRPANMGKSLISFTSQADSVEKLHLCFEDMHKNIINAFANGTIDARN